MKVENVENTDIIQGIVKIQHLFVVLELFPVFKNKQKQQKTSHEQVMPDIITCKIMLESDVINFL